MICLARSRCAQLALADVRAQTITAKDLCNRMIDHVAENLNREINSGFDTVKVNTTVLEIMTAILEESHPKSGADGIEPFTCGPMAGTTS